MTSLQLVTAQASEQSSCDYLTVSWVQKSACACVQNGLQGARRGRGGAHNFGELSIRWKFLHALCQALPAHRTQCSCSATGGPPAAGPATQRLSGPLAVPCGRGSACGRQHGARGAVCVGSPSIEWRRGRVPKVLALLLLDRIVCEVVLRHEPAAEKQQQHRHDGQQPSALHRPRRARGGLSSLGSV